VRLFLVPILVIN